MARNGGDRERARTLFEECLARAEQLDVSELKARSHENLASVYEMAGDRQAREPNTSPPWLSAGAAR